MADGATTLPLSLDSQAARRMESTTSILQKRRIAATTCLAAGYRLKRADYRQCMQALIARDLQRTRQRAKRLVRQAAKRHGMCMSQTTFRIARCIEI